MNKNTIVSIYLKDRDNAVGSVYHLNRFNFLSDNFNVVIITNQSPFIKRYVKKANVISLPNLYKIPFNTYIYWILCKIVLLTEKFDILFLMAPDYLNSIFKFKQKVITSVNINPLQVVGKQFEDTEIGMLGKFHLSLLIRGIAKSDKIIAVSEQLKQFCIDQGISPEKVQYLPHGVDMDMFNSEIESKYNNLERIKNKFIIMYSGWVSEIRGMEFLLNVMKMISKEDIALVFLGCQTDYANKINDFAKHNCLEQNIIAMDAVDPCIVPHYLKISHICVSLLEVNEYYRTSPPQKLFEYLAMGKPVIANDIPTHTDYIKNGYNGFIIEDANGFIDSVLKLYKDKLLYESMSRNAIKSAKEYDIKYVNNKLLNLLTDLTIKK